jgi:hypothetical protein
MEVSGNRVLVPLGPENKDLKALYHALALAERIRAKIFILLFKHCGERQKTHAWVEEAVLDVVNSACQEGLSVSYHIAEDAFEEEIIALVESEHIDLIVFSADGGPMEEALRRIMPRVSSRIIRVQEKNHVNYL